MGQTKIADPEDAGAIVTRRDVQQEFRRTEHPKIAARYNGMVNDFDTQVDQAIRRGVAALLAMQKEDGQFVYRTGTAVKEPDPKYNILRHAGATYSIIEGAAFAPGDVTSHVERGLRWVERDHLRPFLEAGELMLGVASDDRTDHQFASFKLGGTALYLIAALRAVETGMMIFPRSALRALGAFMRWMQQPDGGFGSKYHRHLGEIDPEFVSLYYPGEAALAFLYMHRADPDGPWLNSAERALSFLAKLRDGRDRVEADHWALVATALYFEVVGKPSGSVQTSIANHAAQIVRSMLAEIEIEPTGVAEGCWTHDGRTCPTATRLEGLTTIWPYLKTIGSDEQLHDRVATAVIAGARFLMTAQRTDGGITRSSRVWLETHDLRNVSRADEVRIDYIQHTICGLIGAMRVLSSSVPE
jgi:hypothetical protein